MILLQEIYQRLNMSIQLNGKAGKKNLHLDFLSKLVLKGENAIANI